MPSATTTMKIRRQRTVSRQAIGKQARPAPAKSSTGTPKFSGIASQATLGKGLSHPPQKSVTATAETTIMLTYSARK